MRWAITPRGIGKKVGARSIKIGWPLATGETFFVDTDLDISQKVLAEDQVSLRDGTSQELDTTPTIDNIYDDVILNQKVLKALVLALNTGTFIPNSNYTGPQMKTIIKAKM